VPTPAPAPGLGRALRGAPVYLAGEHEPAARASTAAAVAAAGARLVGGPLPGTDYYVEGEATPARLIARLERAGVRRLRRGELGGRA
jgi:hypothetical protein